MLPLHHVTSTEQRSDEEVSIIFHLLYTLYQQLLNINNNGMSRSLCLARTGPLIPSYCTNAQSDDWDKPTIIGKSRSARPAVASGSALDCMSLPPSPYCHTDTDINQRQDVQEQLSILLSNSKVKLKDVSHRSLVPSLPRFIIET